MTEIEFESKVEDLFDKSPMKCTMGEVTSDLASAEHAVVYANGNPVFVTGLINDPRSISKAKRLSENKDFALCLGYFGATTDLTPTLTYGAKKGAELNWEEEHSFIGIDNGAQTVEGARAMVTCGMNMTKIPQISFFMCVTQSIVSIFDDSCPDFGCDLLLPPPAKLH